MLNVEYQWEINSIIDSSLQIIKQKYTQFAQLIFRVARPNLHALTIEFIRMSLTSFSEDIEKQLLAFIASIFQNSDREVQSVQRLVAKNDEQERWMKEEEYLESEIKAFVAGSCLSNQEFLNSLIIENTEEMNRTSVEQLKIQECASQHEEISKKAKIITLNQKQRRFQQQLLNDLAPFQTKVIEGQQNMPLCSLIQLIQKNVKSQLIDNPQFLIMNPIQKICKLRQMNSFDVQIYGVQKSDDLFYQFFNQKNNKRKMQEYKLSKGIKKLSWRDQKSKIQALNEDQILQQLKKLNPQELIQLKKQFNEWTIKLQKKSWKHQQICHSHRQKIHYLRDDQIVKDKIYLCNQCILDAERQSRKIVCKKHRKPIRCKLSPKQENIEKQKEQQTYMCKQCLLFTHQKYDLVSCCHYRVIQQLCIQQSCVETDDFMICSICQKSPDSKHEHHKIVNFNSESLMKLFSLQGMINISFYEKELIKAKEMLRLSLLQKIRISIIEKTNSTMKFFESFSVYDNFKVSEWVKSFMDGGKKEDLMVLTGILRINEENLSDIDKLSYFETANYVLQEELQGMFKCIWQIIMNSCKKINKLKKISKKQVTAKLNYKYEQILDIQRDEKVIVFPMKLSDINLIHHSRIQKITVIKEREAQRDEAIEKELRNRIRIFFRQEIRRVLHRQQVGAQEQREII